MLPDSETHIDIATTQPVSPLRPFVHRYTGYHYAGLPPGVHRGLPTPYLSLMIGLPVSDAPDMCLGRSAVAPSGLACGLQRQAAGVEHNGNLCGIQIDLTPAGARSLLGVLPAELTSLAVPLDAVLGPHTAELLEQLAAAPDWRARFDAIDAILQRRTGQVTEAERSLTAAWGLLLAHGGNITVSQIASQVGWSRRQLGERFRREYGLTPKEAARLTRFHRSRVLLQRSAKRALGDVAAAAGYSDQAHLTREWGAFAGCPPSSWLATEVLPFVQDSAGSSAAH